MTARQHITQAKNWAAAEMKKIPKGPERYHSRYADLREMKRLLERGRALYDSLRKRNK